MTIKATTLSLGFLIVTAGSLGTYAYLNRASAGAPNKEDKNEIAARAETSADFWKTRSKNQADENLSPDQLMEKIQEQSLELGAIISLRDALYDYVDASDNIFFNKPTFSNKAGKRGGFADYLADQDEAGSSKVKQAIKDMPVAFLDGQDVLQAAATAYNSDETERDERAEDILNTITAESATEMAEKLNDYVAKYGPKQGELWSSLMNSVRKRVRDGADPETLLADLDLSKTYPFETAALSKTRTITTDQMENVISKIKVTTDTLRREAMPTGAEVQQAISSQDSGELLEMSFLMAALSDQELSPLQIFEALRSIPLNDETVTAKTIDTYVLGINGIKVKQ
jgi:hypothetical protein